ncbi:MAG: gliding motility lipoprotein GldH [Bacteroidales bacterium]|nr:gliding motility lipoprotein GldH [Bacteroidales bacterium]MBN2762773.1 gliding motility lipoprotein GldH [Bacteroidales bacterium]
MKYCILPGLFMLFILTSACNDDKVYHRFIEIPGNKWNAKSIIHFDVSVTDTVRSHNVYLFVRNNANYKYSNLYLFVTTTSPMGFSVRDTVELMLADRKGKWAGRGAADIYTSKHPYKLNVRFPYRGVYSFDIQQALWDTDLKNISDIGLRIDRLP